MPILSSMIPVAKTWNCTKMKKLDRKGGTSVLLGNPCIRQYPNTNNWKNGHCGENVVLEKYLFLCNFQTDLFPQSFKFLWLDSQHFRWDPLSPFHFYYSLPPATKLRQGNFFTPVCHSVHRGSAKPPLCRHLSGVDTPLGRHSLPLGRHSFPLGRPPGQTPLHRHPPGQTPPHADTPPEQTPPGQTSPPAQYILGYGQQAGSMHPTGMHSCLYWANY